MDPPKSDGGTSPGSSKSGASVPEEIEMKDMTESGGGHSSGSGTAAGSSSRGASTQAGGPVVRSTTTPSGNTSTPKKGETAGERPTGGEHVQMTVISVTRTTTTSERTSVSGGSADQESACRRTTGRNVFSLINFWWQHRTQKEKLICVLKLVGIILVIALFVFLLLNIKFKGPSSSTTTSPFTNESTSGLSPEGGNPVIPVEGSTIDYGDGSESLSPDLPITEESFEPSTAETEGPISSSIHGIEPSTPGSGHDSEAPTPGSTHDIEPSTPGSGHGVEPSTPGSGHGVETPTLGPIHDVEPSTPGSGHGVEPSTPGSTQETSTPTAPTRHPDRQQYEEYLNTELNFLADPCDNFYKFVCSKSKLNVSIKMQTYHLMLKTLEPAMQYELDNRHNISHKASPMAVRLVVDLYFACISAQRGMAWFGCINTIFLEHAFVCTRLYVDYFTFGVNSANYLSLNRQKATQLFVYLVATFKKDLEQYITWLDDETRKKALERLGRLTTSINMDLNDLVFNDNFLNYLYNVKNNSYPTHYLSPTMHVQVMREKLKSTKDKVANGELDGNSPYYENFINLMESFLASQSASYVDLFNILIIPIHWLGLPMFSPTFPAFYNFASFGTVVAHEISHGFDITNARVLMSNVTQVRFEEQAQCFVRQFDQLPLLGWDMATLHPDAMWASNMVNGNKTCDENVADSGAIKIAYYAFKQFIESGHTANDPFLHSSNLRNFTDDQMFFISNALLRCEKPVDADHARAKEREYYGGVHSPAWHRVNMPMCNFDRFSEAFNCPPASRMNCHEKCVVW